jgi:hypothetical protein
MIMFLSFLWVIAPLTVSLLGGSMFWIVASGLIGGVVVFGSMGLTGLLDGWGRPIRTPEQQQIEASFHDIEELQSLFYTALDRGDLTEAHRLRAELAERTEQVRAMLGSAFTEAAS